MLENKIKLPFQQQYVCPPNKSTGICCNDINNKGCSKCIYEWLNVEANRQHDELCKTCDRPCGVEWSDTERECFVCGKPTHWLDMDYEGYVCSLKCQDKAAKDVQNIACKTCPKLQELREENKRLRGRKGVSHD
jgi:hypothetical protein